VCGLLYEEESEECEAVSVVEEGRENRRKRVCFWELKWRFSDTLIFKLRSKRYPYFANGN
jgi:hypothetical protein